MFIDNGVNINIIEKEEKKSLDNLVRALAADYMRRQRIIREGQPARRVRMELLYLNSKIYESACEICAPTLADVFIKEIGEGVGYAKSSVECVSETTYKLYKSKIMGNIAKKLYLIG